MWEENEKDRMRETVATTRGVLERKRLKA